MIADKYTEFMYGFLDRVITGVGPREACSEEERRAGELFASEIEPVCERVDRERFTCSPRAVFGIFPYFVLAYVIGVVCYYFLPPVSVALMALVTVIFSLELFRQREVVDPLFARKEGENVSGVVPPRGEVKRRVVFSAHLDSAFEFKLWYWFKNFSIPVMALQVASFLFLFGVSLARTVQNSRGIPEGGVYGALGIVCIALVPVVALLLVFRTNDLVPGAMDDMAGVAVLAGLGKYLEEARDGSGFYPENTEVVLVGMSSEEAGLRGAKRYAARHEREMKDLPTHGIFFDGICDEGQLTVNTREVWPGARHDPYLVRLAQSAAEKNGFEIKTWAMAFGATDAAAFSRSGIPSVSILSQKTSSLPPNYHTRLDTVENVRPEALAVCLQMAIDMLESIDGERTDSG